MRQSIYLFSFMSLFFAVGRLSAGTVTWTNDAGGSYHAPENWEPNRVPGMGDTAVFDRTNRPYTVTWSSSIGCMAVNVNAGTLTWELNGKTYSHSNWPPTKIGTTTRAVNLTITNGTVSAMAGYKSPLASVSGSGTVLRLMKASLNLSYPGVGSYVTVFANAAPASGNSWGTRTDGGIGLGAKMIFTNGAKIASNKLALNAGSLLSIAGGSSAIGIANGFPAGSFVELLAGADVGQGFPDPSIQTAVRGTLTLKGNSRYYAIYPSKGQSFAIQPGGIVQGDGRLENFTNFWNLGGSIWPGGSNAIGRLTVKGTNTFDSGTLVLELAGTNQCDQFFTLTRPLIINGGTLRVNLIKGFVPAYRDRFKLLDFPQVAGKFDVLELDPKTSHWNTEDLYITGEIQYLPRYGTVLFIQ